MRTAIMITLAAGACGKHTITPTPDAGVDPDPLDLVSTAPAGSLDDLHERIIAKRCSGQPGLCHNGQFEPNLSTPGLTYAYLVNRPGLEKNDRLRVRPGSAAQSLFIDKIRNRGGVATQMPLGAEPLEEADVKALEAWIDGGALRAPGAAPAPVLNNPPKRPEIGYFNTSNVRLDGVGPVQINAGQTLVIRHSVQDFETADDAIPFSGILLTLDTGQNVVLAPGTNDPVLGLTKFDAAGPQGKGDKLDYQRSWPIANPLPVRDANNQIINIDPRGHSVSVLAVYVDSATMGIVAFDTSPTLIEIK